MKKIVILDVDGTLINTFPRLQSLYMARGITLDHDRFRRARKYLKYIPNVKAFFKLFQERHALRAEMGEWYAEEAEFYPEMSRLLEDLVQAVGVQPYILTRNYSDKPEVNVKALFARLGFDLEKAIYCVPVKQNKQTAIQQIIRQAGVSPENVIFVGDEIGDARDAIQVGIKPSHIVMHTGGFDHLDRLEILKKTKALLRSVPQKVAAGVRDLAGLNV